MKLQFLGATDTVTGSKYLLRCGAHNLLVDCGLFQGLKPLRVRNWNKLPVRPADIHAVVLTHATLTTVATCRCWRARASRAKVFCTPATADLCPILLPDSGHLRRKRPSTQGATASANTPGRSRCTPGRRPALPQAAASGRVRPGLRARARRTGAFVAVGPHGGSSFVRLDDGTAPCCSPALAARNDPCSNPGGDGRRRLPGGRVHLRRPAASASRYPGRTGPGDQPYRGTRGGVVVIPAFAVGRAQSLLHSIGRLRARGLRPTRRCT